MTASSSPYPTAASDAPPRRSRRRLLVFLCAGGCLLELVCAVAAAGLLSAARPLRGPTGLKDDFMPAWSPDGRRIAFASYRDGNADIYTIQPDGSHMLQLTQDPFAMLRPGRYWPSDIEPSWSPDGSQILFISSRDNGNQTWQEFRPFLMDADGQNQGPLQQKWLAWPAGDRVSDTWELAWSPDGSRMAWSCPVGWKATGEPTFRGICVRSSSGAVVLTSANAHDRDPEWPPDGHRLLFSSDRDGDFDIYVINSDGSRLKQLTLNWVDDYCPHWSPDGSRIAFTSDRDGNAEIYVMNADGTNQTRLTSNAADDYYSDWSPDGQRLVFVSTRAGHHHLYIMDADGSNVVALTHD